MKVYRMKANLDEKNISFFCLFDKEASEKFKKELGDGTPVPEEFQFVELERDKTNLREKEFMDCSKVWIAVGTVLLNQKAKDCLESVFGDYVEYVPAKYQDDIYYMVNVLNTIDAIDYEKSVFHTTDDGIPYYVRECSLKQYMVEGISIFRVFLEESVYSPDIFVSQEVKDIVEANGLTGFSFEEVWRMPDRCKNQSYFR